MQGMETFADCSLDRRRSGWSDFKVLPAGRFVPVEHDDVAGILMGSMRKNEADGFSFGQRPIHRLKAGHGVCHTLEPHQSVHEKAPVECVQAGRAKSTFYLFAKHFQVVTLFGFGVKSDRAGKSRDLIVPTVIQADSTGVGILALEGQHPFVKHFFQG